MARISLLALTGFADPLYNVIFYRNNLHITVIMLLTKSIFKRSYFRTSNNWDLLGNHKAPDPKRYAQSKNAKAAVKLCKLTRVIRHMPVLTSHILIVLSLDPDSKNGPGLPLFLVYRKHIKSNFLGKKLGDLNDNYATMICISNFVKTHFFDKNCVYFRHTTYVLSYVYKWLLQSS